MDIDMDYVKDELSREVAQESDEGGIWITKLDVERGRIPQQNWDMLLPNKNFYDILSDILNQTPTKDFTLVSLNGHCGFAPPDTKVNEKILEIDGLHEVLVAREMDGTHTYVLRVLLLI